MDQPYRGRSIAHVTLSRGTREFQKLDHFFIACLGEVAIMRAHGIERFGRHQTDDFVRQRRDLPQAVRRRHRDREDQALRPGAPGGENGGPDCRAGRNSVVDDQGRAAAEEISVIPSEAN